MFLINQTPLPYVDPWLFPLADRCQRMQRGKHRVAYLYETLDSTTFRYRVYNMIQALETIPDVAATYFTRGEIDVLRREIDHIDTLVVTRYRYSPKLNQLITAARSRGKRVLFDVDDLIYDVDYIQLILATLDQDLNLPEPGLWDVWFAHSARLGAALKLCEAAITTNEFLAEHIRAFTGKPVAVIPNFMNREQLALGQKIFEEKRASGFARTGRIHLGYFSGTPTHNRDLELMAGALARLLERNPQVVLRLVGYMELKGPLGRFANRVERFEFHDFVNLQRLIGEVEVNLMPLQDNVFTSCKSELKYFEAGIVGTVSIASPVVNYRKSITDGVNGFVAASYQWDAKLDAALEQLALGKYPALAEAAYQDSEQRYAFHRHSHAIAETLFSSPAPRRSADDGLPAARESAGSP